MEQTITCPACRYTFRIAKEIFEKYRTGVSLKKHEVTDGDAILLDCAGCGRTLRISITTWNVVGDGPAQHTRGYEWVGGQRPRLAGESEASINADAATASLSESPAQSAGRIHLTEFGRVEKPSPEIGLGASLSLLFLCILPLVAILGEPVVIALADDAGYRVPSPSSRDTPALPAVTAPGSANASGSENSSPGQAAVTSPPKEVDEPRLLTPVKEPTFLKGGNLERMLRKYNKQMEDVEKQGAPAK